jgi:toxin YoeB
MRETTFHQKAWEDFVEWAKQDIKTFLRLAALIDEVKRTPFVGKGKPEPLKGDFKGCWSRRITEEHRLIYKVDDHRIVIVACKGHYK